MMSESLGPLVPVEPGGSSWDLESIFCETKDIEERSDERTERAPASVGTKEREIKSQRFEKEFLGIFCFCAIIKSVRRDEYE